MMMPTIIMHNYLLCLDLALQVIVDDNSIRNSTKTLGFGSADMVVLISSIALMVLRRRSVESEEEAVKHVIYIDPDLAIEEFAPTFQALTCLLVTHHKLRIPKELGFDRSQLWLGYTQATNDDLQRAAEKVKSTIRFSFPSSSYVVSAAS